MNNLSRPYSMALGAVILLHLVGFLGMALPSASVLPDGLGAWPNFAALTPFHLLAMGGLLAYFHPKWDKPFGVFVALSFLLGFFIEVAGVHTKAVFGHYWYEENLGWKIWGAPLVIGLNWAVLSYCAGHLVKDLPLPLAVKAFLGALAMVALDVAIEPAAMRLGFWQWAGGEVPLQNYIAWVAVGYPMVLVYLSSKPEKNALATPVLLAQSLFFVGFSVLSLLGL